MLKPFHHPQSLMVWRSSLVLLQQFTSTGDLQAWCLPVQVLTTCLGGRAVPLPSCPTDLVFLRRLPRAAPYSGDVCGHSQAEMGPDGPTVAEGGHALGGASLGPLQPFTVGCSSSSVPAFLLLPTAVRGFCAAEKSGRGGDHPQTLQTPLLTSPCHAWCAQTLPGLRPVQLCLDVDRRPLGLCAVSGAEQLTPCF